MHATLRSMSPMRQFCASPHDQVRCFGHLAPYDSLAGCSGSSRHIQSLVIRSLAVCTVCETIKKKFPPRAVMAWMGLMRNDRYRCHHSPLARDRLADSFSDLDSLFSQSSLTRPYPDISSSFQHQSIRQAGNMARNDKRKLPAEETQEEYAQYPLLPGYRPNCCWTARLYTDRK